MKKELVLFFLLFFCVSFVFAVEKDITFAGCQGSTNPSHLTASPPSSLDVTPGEVVSIKSISGTVAGRIYSGNVYFHYKCDGTTLDGMYNGKVTFAEFLDSSGTILTTKDLYSLKTKPFTVPAGATTMSVYMIDGGAYDDNSGDSLHCTNGYRTHPAVNDPCRVTFEIAPGAKVCSDFEDGVCGMLDDGQGGVIDCTDVDENGDKVCVAQQDIARSPLYCDAVQPNKIFYDRTDRLGSCSVASGVEVNEGMCNEEVVTIGVNCPGSHVCQAGIDGGEATCAEASYVNYWASFTSSDPLPSNTLIDANDFVRIISTAPASSGYTIFRNQDSANVIETVTTRFWRAQSGEQDVQFSSADGVSDNFIDVSTTGSDTPMEIAIVNPVCGSAYNKTDSIVVALHVFDPDDFVTGTVRENGVLIHSFNNLQGPEVSFEHVFNAAGNVQFLVEANNTRNERFRQFVNIMIVDNTSSSRDYYTASCIDSPKNFERFSTTTVPFNAESSNAIVYDGSVVPAVYTAISHADLNYSWTFYHDGELLPGKCVGLGSKKCDGSAASSTESTYRFTRTFSTVNDNSVRLSVSIPANFL